MKCDLGIYPHCPEQNSDLLCPTSTSDTTYFLYYVGYVITALSPLLHEWDREEGGALTDMLGEGVMMTWVLEVCNILTVDKPHAPLNSCRQNVKRHCV